MLLGDGTRSTLVLKEHESSESTECRLNFKQGTQAAEPTGIDKTTNSTDIEEVSRYSVNGQRLVGPTKGLNIVKYSDGSVKKVAVE